MGAAPAVVVAVEQALRRLGADAGAIVVAVSGGPDSVALFRALSAARARLRAAGPFVVAHFNHQLRGVEGDDDEEFVRVLVEAAAARGIASVEFRGGRGDVAGQGGNREATARRLRYAWLAEIARQTGAPLVATGHTADDQAETVLHRLLRGTGLKGLAGIAPRRPLVPGVDLVRPLLSVTRAEVLGYLESEGQDYRTDSSNLNLDYTRNRLRHELLPLLASGYNPAVRSVLCRLAEQSAAAFRDEEARAAALLAEAELPRAGTVLVFDARRLSSASRATVCEAFRLIWAREGWPQREMGFADWDRLAALASGELTAADLPGRMHARRRGDVVQLHPFS